MEDTDSPAKEETISEILGFISKLITTAGEPSNIDVSIQLHDVRIHFDNPNTYAAWRNTLSGGHEETVTPGSMRGYGRAKAGMILPLTEYHVNRGAYRYTLKKYNKV